MSGLLLDVLPLAVFGAIIAVVDQAAVATLPSADLSRKLTAAMM